MKVLLIDTSEQEKDVLSEDLQKISEVLKACGIETEILWTGKKELIGCTGCGKCIRKNRCIHEDMVDVITGQADSFDGWVIGCQVLYGDLSEQADHLLKRLMISANNRMSHKTVLAVLKKRRQYDHEAEHSLKRYFDQAASVYPERWCLDARGEEDLSACAKAYARVLKDSYEERENAVPVERLTGFTR